MRIKFLISVFTVVSFAGFSGAKSPVEKTAELPLFVGDPSNPNDFSLFANGGWDGYGWYVGFNRCWIQKLAVPAKGHYTRAFIGAKLGRMKTFKLEGKNPWERNVSPHPGEIRIAISSKAVWLPAQSFFLVSTEDIPLEPDPELTYEEVGESRWFWVEVPLDKINFSGDNYLALWSPTEKLNSSAIAPILAAAWGTMEINSWMNDQTKGAPPEKPESALATPVQRLEPAIALKLVSGKKVAKPSVKIVKIEEGKAKGKLPAPKIVWANIEGNSIERTWVEVSTDSVQWNKFGKYSWNTPYSYSLKMEEVPIGTEGKTWIRIGCTNLWENVSWSEPVNIFELTEEEKND